MSRPITPGSKASRPRWPKERDAVLTRMWNGGRPASEIGQALGTTKNAVVGRAHRIGLDRRPSPIGRGRPKLPTSTADLAKKPEPEPTHRKRVPNTTPDRIKPRRSLMGSFVGARFAACQWIEGEPIPDDQTGHRDSCKCGEPTQPGFVYCEAHVRRAYSASPAEEAA